MPVLTLPESGTFSLSVRAKALVFDDPRSRGVLERIQQVAPSEATILLTGETGTGKEIVARHIHQSSRRKDGPFVAVNCGAFSENLVESELFGHERGAFTGALQAKAGWFEAARGGTLFLDEVGDLPLSAQVKLLRVLQESEVVRLGSRQAIPIDVRLVAATNVDLQEAMAAGHFREDLFYRLNVVSVGLPPLRERPGDIAPLARYFVEVYERRLGLGHVELTGAAVEKLLGHSWPGNIRELENTVHHALLVCRGGRVEGDDIRVSPSPARGVGRRSSEPPRSGDPFERLEQAFQALFEHGVDHLHERIEETLIKSAYRYSDQNQLQTARLLGISRNVVRARLIQHGELVGQLRNTAPPPASAVTRAPGPRQRRLRMGYQKFGRLLLVKALGELDAALRARDVHVEWIEFPGGLQLVDALHANKVDVGVVGECPPVFAQAAAVPIVYLAAEPSAPEAEAIVARADSSLHGVSDLRGRTIALNRGANVHYLLMAALEEAGLTVGEVQTVFLEPAQAEQAFLAGSIDAWAIWDPWLGAVRQKVELRTLRDGRGLTQNTAYYMARREFAEAEPSVIDEVLAQVEHAGAFARQRSDDAARLIEVESGMPPAVLANWLHRSASAVRMSPEVVLAQQRIADRLFGLNLVQKSVRIADAQWNVAV